MQIKIGFNMFVFSRVNQVIRDNVNIGNVKNYINSALRGVEILFDDDGGLHAPIRSQVFTGILMFVGMEMWRNYSLASGDAANCSAIYSGTYDIESCKSSIRHIEPIVRYACDHLIQCAKATRTVFG